MIIHSSLILAFLSKTIVITWACGGSYLTTGKIISIRARHNTQLYAVCVCWSHVVWQSL